MVQEEPVSTETNSDKSEREWAEEAYARRRDPALWRVKGERIIVPPPPHTAVVSSRLPIDDFETLVQAAQAAGETLSEFVRKAVALRIGVRTPQIQYATGVATELDSARSVGTLSSSAERRDAPYSQTLTRSLVTRT